MLFQGSLEEWLRLLRLEEYGPCLVSQGYSTVQEVATISIEDLEVSSSVAIALSCHQSTSWNINIENQSFQCIFQLYCVHSAITVLASRRDISPSCSSQLIRIPPRRTRASTAWATRSD